MNKMQFRIILSFCLKNHGRRQRCARSGASADRRKLKPKMKMAALCRDAATKSFQRDLSRRIGVKTDDPDGNGDGAARSEFRLQPGRVNAELPTQITATARDRARHEPIIPRRAELEAAGGFYLVTVRKDRLSGCVVAVRKDLQLVSPGVNFPPEFVILPRKLMTASPSQIDAGQIK
jgi:hypothetical protein